MKYGDLGVVLFRMSNVVHNLTHVQTVSPEAIDAACHTVSPFLRAMPCAVRMMLRKAVAACNAGVSNRSRHISCQQTSVRVRRRPSSTGISVEFCSDYQTSSSQLLASADKLSRGCYATLPGATAAAAAVEIGVN